MEEETPVESLIERFAALDDARLLVDGAPPTRASPSERLRSVLPTGAFLLCLPLIGTIRMMAADNLQASKEAEFELCVLVAWSVFGGVLAFLVPPAKAAAAAVIGLGSQIVVVILGPGENGAGEISPMLVAFFAGPAAAIAFLAVAVAGGGGRADGGPKAAAPLGEAPGEPESWARSLGGYFATFDDARLMQVLDGSGDYVAAAVSAARLEAERRGLVSPLQGPPAPPAKSHPVRTPERGWVLVGNSVVLMASLIGAARVLDRGATVPDAEYFLLFLWLDIGAILAFVVPLASAMAAVAIGLGVQALLLDFWAHDMFSGVVSIAAGFGAAIAFLAARYVIGAAQRGRSSPSA